jgi:hypothetical protein
MTIHPAYTRLEERPFESTYLVQDVVIAAPPDAVWPYAVRIGDWMRKHEIVTIDGVAGEVGHFERVRPPALEAETPEPHHHVHGVGALILSRYSGLEVGAAGSVRPVEEPDEETARAEVLAIARRAQSTRGGGRDDR